MHVGLHASNSQACRAKLRGTNLKAKVQTLVLWIFRNHLCGLTYIDTTIHTNIHNTQYSHIHIDNHTYISTCLPTHVYNYINNKHRSNTYLDINTNIEIFEHLCIYLDQKLNFTCHIKGKVIKSNKGIGVIKQLLTKLPWNALLTIYKSFIRPHLDCCMQTYMINLIMTLLKNKLGRIQYNAALAITGAIH